MDTQSDLCNWDSGWKTHTFITITIRSTVIHGQHIYNRLIFGSSMRRIFEKSLSRKCYDLPRVVYEYKLIWKEFRKCVLTSSWSHMSSSSCHLPVSIKSGLSKLLLSSFFSTEVLKKRIASITLNSIGPISKQPSPISYTKIIHVVSTVIESSFR